MLNQRSISLDEAFQAIAGGRSKALEIGSPSNIAVVDAGGNLLAFARMDGAWLGSIDIAINKAFTARAFEISTIALGPLAAPGAEFYGIQHSNGGRVMIFAGGMPFTDQNAVVGAIGVSGGHGFQDQLVAEAAVNCVTGSV